VEDPLWVKIRSWHVVKSQFTSRGGTDMATTLCGRTTSGPTAEEVPSGERTCESCLRILTKDV
jgi:hypothetical protein